MVPFRRFLAYHPRPPLLQPTHHVRTARVLTDASVRSPAAPRWSVPHRRRADDLAQARDVNHIARHVLQNLIIASGVDWTEDATLLDLMLRLEGTPLVDGTGPA